ncbi:MAG: twin-arginine translocation signal domain-containing protein [Acidimicrobiales bacterium]
MGDITEPAGIHRRDLIKKSAIAGAAAWTAPAIIDSFISPAAASSISFPTSCSYGLIVFTYQGNTYVMKIESGSSTCSGSNTTSADDSFSEFQCGAFYYRGGELYGQTLQRGATANAGTAITPYPGDPCPSLFTINGSTVSTNNAGVSIVFAVSHHGPAAGWQGSKFYPVCVNNGNGGSSVTLNCG